MLFAGEIAGFLNPMGEGISAGTEGYCAAKAIMKHFDDLKHSRKSKGFLNYVSARGEILPYLA